MQKEAVRIRDQWTSRFIPCQFFPIFQPNNRVIRAVHRFVISTASFCTPTSFNTAMSNNLIFYCNYKIDSFRSINFMVIGIQDKNWFSARSFIEPFFVMFVKLVNIVRIDTAFTFSRSFSHPANALVRSNLEINRLK